MEDLPTHGSNEWQRGASFNVRMRWRIILSLWGLGLFGLLTYGSVRMNDSIRPHGEGRYFWWGSLRLDSDPLNRHQLALPCVQGSGKDCGVETEYIWVHAGWVEIALKLSAFPVFLLARSIAQGLGHFGVSEVRSFLLAMLVGTLAWFYGVGWLLDRRRFKRSLRRRSNVPN